MKKSKKIVGVALTSAMVLGATSAFAAMPVDTVIVNNNAYNFDYFKNTPAALLEVGAALDAQTPIYVKFDADAPKYFEIISKELVAANVIPAVTYYPAEGEPVPYAAGDQDIEEDVVGPTASFVAPGLVLNNDSTLTIQFDDALAAAVYANEALLDDGYNDGMILMITDDEDALVETALDVDSYDWDTTDSQNPTLTLNLSGLGVDEELALEEGYTISVKFADDAAIVDDADNALTNVGSIVEFTVPAQ